MEENSTSNLRDMGGSEQKFYKNKNKSYEGEMRQEASVEKKFDIQNVYNLLGINQNVLEKCSIYPKDNKVLYSYNYFNFYF